MSPQEILELEIKATTLSREVTDLRDILNNMRESLVDIRDSLQELANVAKDAPQPTRAVLDAQIFLLIQKVRGLLGEEDQ